MENKVFKKEIYKVKKSMLDYNEFVSFVENCVNSLITEDGISLIARDMVFKLYFATYYLDIDLPKDDLEAYPLVANIDFEDYASYIAWTQFLDLQKAFDRYCDYVNELTRKSTEKSLIELLDSGKQLIDKINDSVENVNFKDMIDIFSSFSKSVGDVTEEKLIRVAFDNIMKEKEREKEEVTVEDDTKKMN